MVTHIPISLILIMLILVFSFSCSKDKTANPGVENSATKVYMFDNEVKTLKVKNKTYKETAVTAYSVKDLSSFFKTKPAHDIEIILTDKTKKTLKYSSFLNTYITKQAVGVSPLCFSENADISNIYAIISGSDGILFPIAGQQITGPDFVKLFKINSKITKYKFVAIDGYELECTAKQMKTAVITIDSNGSISAKLPIEKGAGRINDILYIEAVK